MENERTSKLYADLWLIVFLVVVAVSVEILAFFPITRPNSESAASWFQRTGAITSIFAGFAQFRLSNFSASVRGTTFAESWRFHYFFKTHQYVLSWVIALVTVWGAIVWGYGDLFVKFISK
jgi:hypothetical protein